VDKIVHVDINIPFTRLIMYIEKSAAVFILRLGQLFVPSALTINKPVFLFTLLI
jgi:hypothetical protein